MLVAQARSAGSRGGAVIGFGDAAGGQAGLQCVDRQIAGKGNVGAGKVAAGDDDSRSIHTVVTHLERATAAQITRDAGCAERKGHRTTVGIDKGICAASVGALRQGVFPGRRGGATSGIALVLHHGREAAGAAISGVAVTRFDEQLVGGYNGEVALLRVIKIVVGCRQTASLQNAGVGSGGFIGASATARNGKPRSG